MRTTYPEDGQVSFLPHEIKFKETLVVGTRSSIDLEELGTYGQEELNQFLSHDVSFVVKFLAVASLVLCIAPSDVKRCTDKRRTMANEKMQL